MILLNYIRKHNIPKEIDENIYPLFFYVGLVVNFLEVSMPHFDIIIGIDVVIAFTPDSAPIIFFVEVILFKI